MIRRNHIIVFGITYTAINVDGLIPSYCGLIELDKDWQEEAVVGTG